MSDHKPKPLKMAIKTNKVTVKMPKKLKEALPGLVLSHGYNMRQKSKWVAEAVESLLSRPGWEGALLSEVIAIPDAQDVFSLPENVMTLITTEARRVTIENPSLNANQSTIVRAAINRRLMGFFNKVQ